MARTSANLNDAPTPRISLNENAAIDTRHAFNGVKTLNWWHTHQFAIVTASAQSVFIVLFGLFVQYDSSSSSVSLTTQVIAVCYACAQIRPSRACLPFTQTMFACSIFAVSSTHTVVAWRFLLHIVKFYVESGVERLAEHNKSCSQFKHDQRFGTYKRSGSPRGFDRSSEHPVLSNCLQQFYGATRTIRKYKLSAKFVCQNRCCSVEIRNCPCFVTFAVFQDVHIMVFIGFGFLAAFLRRYGFSSIGLNFLLAAITIQWATLMQGFWRWCWFGPPNKIGISVSR